MTTASNELATAQRTALRAFQAYAAVGIAVFLLMMLVGVTMRGTHAQWLGVNSAVFYQLMTLHGAGMVGTSGLAGAAVMWYFLRRHVALSNAMFVALLGLSLLGVVLIIGAIAIGGFAGGWTFLYPLPAKSVGLWGPHAAAAYVVGLLLIGVGFLLFYLDCALALIRQYGNLARSLGLNRLFSGSLEDAPPPAVVASTMVVIVNVCGILAGAVVLVMTLVNLYVPVIVFDALLMKNLIFFFGHVFINAAIYMAVIGVYEVLPRYTGRPWKTTRPFLWSWAAVTLLVMAVYPHHLLMDFVMPQWAAVLGQVLSYASGIPVLLVTTYGALVNIYRSGIKWDLPSRLLVFGLFGWSIGVVPAIVDATIKVNLVMHNTLWVPGHFHLYLLLGLLPMIVGTILYAATRTAWSESALDRAAFWIFGTAGLVFCLTFLAGGRSGVPRRFAEHDLPWVPLAQIATVAGLIVLGAAIVLGIRTLMRLPRVDLNA
ncbi:MAG: cbb3-type cytochrome c oxidase subunit I [Burkholderiaceae bacterium]|nr:cbb3-type cytochrome c oxidase subunit I [Burkholderiaceae bacterium]